MPFMRRKKRQKADLLDYTQLNVIFHNANGTQTGDGVKLRNNGVYNSFGDTGITSIENTQAMTNSMLQSISICWAEKWRIRKKDCTCAVRATVSLKFICADSRI